MGEIGDVRQRTLHTAIMTSKTQGMARHDPSDLFTHHVYELELRDLLIDDGSTLLSGRSSSVILHGSILLRSV